MVLDPGPLSEDLRNKEKDATTCFEIQEGNGALLQFCSSYRLAGRAAAAILSECEILVHKYITCEMARNVSDFCAV